MALFARNRPFILSLFVLFLLAACNQATQPTQEPLPSLNLQGLGLDAQYYTNNDFTGPRKGQIDRYIWFDWGSAAPVAALPAEHFSARWQGEIAATDSDEYQFFLSTTGKTKLLINGKRVSNGAKLRLNAGQRLSFVLEYQKTGTTADLKLEWQAKNGEREVVPQSSFFPSGFVNLDLLNVVTGQNLLQNAGFSNGSASWLTFGGESEIVSPGRDGTGQALRASGFAWVQQNLPVSDIEVGQTYKLTANARTVSGSCSVGFAGGGADGRTFDERVSFRTNTWEEQAFIVTMPAGTQWLGVYVASGNANCFVDDVSLLAGDATPPISSAGTLILNGAFEESETYWTRFGGQNQITTGRTGQGYEANTFAWIQQDIPTSMLEVGRSYRFKASAKASAQTCRVGIKIFGNGQTLVSETLSFTSNNFEDKGLDFDLTEEPAWVAVFLATGRSSCTFDDIVLTTPEAEALPYTYPLSADVSTKGAWSEVADWPIIALHMALLANGDVMTFGSNQTGGRAFVYDIWSPSKGLDTNSHVLLEDQSPTDLFCSSQILRPDGQLMTIGGTIGGSENRGSADINFYDSVTGTMSLSPLQMTRGRWYPTATTLANGDVVMQSGYDVNKVDVNTPEVWTDAGWRILTDATNTRAFGGQNRFYPWSFVAPSGKVFIAGPRSEMFLMDTESTGSVQSVGQRDNLFRSYGNAAMFDKNKILVVGGANTPSSLSYVIDISDETSPQVTPTTAPIIARRHANSTILPTGEVLVTGGTSGVGFNDESKAVFSAESWNPDNEQWTGLADASIVRTYHSTAILLPNGAIINSGGGKCGCEIDNFNAQVYLPPYLFKKDGSGELAPRPSMSAAPEQLEYASNFELSVKDASSIARVTLVRSGSTTHAWNNDQRFLELEFTVGANNTLQVTSPEGPTYAPPGFFMLSVIDNEGVPSISKMVQMLP